MDLTPRVFVVHDDATKNLLPAMKYGSLEVILSGRVSVYNTVPVVEAIKRALKTFTSNDFLLLVGDPVAIGIATAYAAYKNGGLVKILKWDRQERAYFEITVDIGLMKEAACADQDL